MLDLKVETESYHISPRKIGFFLIHLRLPSVFFSPSWDDHSFISTKKLLDLLLRRSFTIQSYVQKTLIFFFQYSFFASRRVVLLEECPLWKRWNKHSLKRQFLVELHHTCFKKHLAKRLSLFAAFYLRNGLLCFDVKFLCYIRKIF